MNDAGLVASSSTVLPAIAFLQCIDPLQLDCSRLDLACDDSYIDT